jgi:parallel beta-helix repeat protein
MANYFVGPNQLYAEVQDAISQVVLDAGSVEFTEEYNIIISEDGVYAGFFIPENILKPTAINRLIIGAANNMLPIIDALKTQGLTGSFINGCSIGSGTSYVTIRRMYFRGFLKGISTGPNCHNLIIEKNIVLNSQNVGIWIYQSDQAQVLNNIVFNAKYGIVTTLVKDVALIHNTIFNDQQASTDTDTCVYIGLQKDQGQGILDYGKATLLNNLLFTIAGNVLMINQRDLTNLQSNFNDLYSLSGNIAKIREELLGGSVSVTLIETLIDWRNVTSNNVDSDGYSISQDPVFITQNTEVSNSTIDLSMLASSPCISLGKEVCGDPNIELDDYIDDSLLCSDILGNSRGAAPTIGANEIAIAEGFFGTTVASDPDLQNVDNVECVIGGVLTHIDSVTEQYQSSVSCWMPEVKSGFFFIREKPYYLYADKKAYTLDAIRETIFTMPREIRSPILYVSGKQVLTSSSFEIFGDKFVLKHKGLDITSEADVIAIHGKVRLWSSDHEKFTLRDVMYRFRIRDGIKRYIFPEDPKDAAPIVITDDTIRLLDSNSLLPYEFNTMMSSEGVKLNFHQDSNLVLNPQFEYGNTVSDLIIDYNIDISDFAYIANPFSTVQDDPAYAHQSNGGVYSTMVNDPINLNITEQFVARTLGATTFMHVGAEVPFDYMLKTDGRISSRAMVQVSGFSALRPLMGENMLVFDVPTGNYLDHYVAQEVDHIDPDQNYFFSLYTAAPNETGKLYFDFLTYDGNDVLLKHNSGYSYEISSDMSLASTSLASPWQRLGIGIGNLGESYPVASYVTTVPTDTTALSKIDTGLISIDTNTRKIQFRIYSETGNPIGIDCLQFEKGIEPTRYNRIPDMSDMTVEYESTNSGFYEVKDLTLSPLRNSSTNGFLQIGPVPASDFDEVAPYNSTILTDWFWQAGRLKYLPWAKTSGKNKFSKTTHYHDSGVYVDNDITWDLDIPGPAKIDAPSSVQSCIQGNEPEFASIRIMDDKNNPYAFKRIFMELIESRGLYPGALLHRELGFPDKYGQLIEVESDPNGTVNLFTEAPSISDIQYRGNKPLAVQTTTFPSGTAMDKAFGKLPVDYKISNINHGNIVVRDQNLTAYNLESPSTYTQTIVPSLSSNGITKYDMGDYAVIGSIICIMSAGSTVNRTLALSYQDKPGHGEFIYDDTKGQILISGNQDESIEVTYNRRLAWITIDHPHIINIDKTVLDQITGDIIVDYDIEVSLKITAAAPDRVAGIQAKHLSMKVVAHTPFKNTVAWSLA